MEDVEESEVLDMKTKLKAALFLVVILAAVAVVAEGVRVVNSHTPADALSPKDIRILTALSNIAVQASVLQGCGVNVYTVHMGERTTRAAYVFFTSEDGTTYESTSIKTNEAPRFRSP